MRPRSFVITALSTVCSMRMGNGMVNRRIHATSRLSAVQRDTVGSPSTPRVSDTPDSPPDNVLPLSPESGATMPKINGTLTILTYCSRDGAEWVAVGCNETEAEAWLRYQGLRDGARLDMATDSRGRLHLPNRLHIRSRQPSSSGDTGEGEASVLHAETLDLTHRSSHSRLRRLWQSERLLLHGVRLSELAARGNLAANATLGSKIAERDFRQELVA